MCMLAGNDVVSSTSSFWWSGETEHIISFWCLILHPMQVRKIIEQRTIKNSEIPRAKSRETSSLKIRQQIKQHAKYEQEKKSD